MPHCTATAHNLVSSHAVDGNGPAPVQLPIPRHKCGHPAIDDMIGRGFPEGNVSQLCLVILPGLPWRSPVFAGQRD